MMPDPHDAPAGPYADQAMRYLRAGWAPLPLPARAKKDPPRGWTGAQGLWPSGADVHAWAEDNPGGNSIQKGDLVRFLPFADLLA